MVCSSEGSHEDIWISERKKIYMSKNECLFDQICYETLLGASKDTDEGFWRGVRNNSYFETILSLMQGVFDSLKWVSNWKNSFN